MAPLTSHSVFACAMKTKKKTLKLVVSTKKRNCVTPRITLALHIMLTVSGNRVVQIKCLVE